MVVFLIDVPNPQLSSSLSSTKSITHKKELLEALRRTNPAGVNTAPVIFWDVEGALKTVSSSRSVLHQWIILSMTVCSLSIDNNR